MIVAHAQQQAALWLKQHGARESRLAKLLQGFFGEQRRVILERVAAGDLAPSLLIDTTQWHDRIVQIVSPELVRFAFSSAAAELGGLTALVYWFIVKWNAGDWR